jgi:hypothetical protein
MEKLNSMLLLTNGPAQRNSTARCRNRPQQPARGTAGPARGVDPRALAQRNRGGRGRGHDVRRPRRRGSAVVAGGQRPTPAKSRPASVRTVFVSSWRTQESGSWGERERERARAPEGGARARRPGSVVRGKDLIESYRRRGRSTEARLEERRRWRSVKREQSLGGGSPASERGGENGGSGGERGRARLAFGSQRERGGERVRDGGEAEVRAGCRGAGRAGATGVHAEDTAGMRPPRGIARLRAVGCHAHEGEEGARLGRWSRPGRAGRECGRARGKLGCFGCWAESEAAVR